MSSQPPTIQPFKFILSNATNQLIRALTPPTISVLSIVYQVPRTDCLQPSIFDGAFTFVVLFGKFYYLYFGSSEALAVSDDVSGLLGIVHASCNIYVLLFKSNYGIYFERSRTMHNLPRDLSMNLWTGQPR